MGKNNTANSTSDSRDNLLFNGLIYQIISEPDGIRKSRLDLDPFINKSQSLDINKKVQNIKSALLSVDRNKDRDIAFTAFKSFVERSRYNLIVVDKDFNYIFHNKKSNTVKNKIFVGDEPEKLNTTLISKISKAIRESHQNQTGLITITNAIDNVNAYLFSNRDISNNDQGFHILLVPSLENKNFELQKELVKQYSFTNKETLVLSNLITGYDVQETSEQFNVSLNTIRSHLKSIFRKTDTKSQPDLIRLILKNETQLLDSYIEPTTSTQHFDQSLPTKDLFLTLSTGNKICYRDYGPKDGRPLFIFHNFLGSRFNIPYQHSETLKKSNRRVIIPDRPGYGKSDIVENYNDKWNEMFNEFVELLGIDKFDLLGTVSGSANAINYAETNPAGIQSIILASPLFFNHAQQKKLLGELPQSAAFVVSASKRIALNAFRLWMKSMKSDPEKYIRKMVKQYAGSNEINCLEDQNFIDRLVLNFTESQLNNSNGSAQDAVYSSSPLKLDLTNITVPVEIWIGDEDKCMPVSSAKEICDPIPNKNFHICEGHGEDIFYYKFGDMIQ